jgi:hypothetical protein
MSEVLTVFSFCFNLQNKKMKFKCHSNHKKLFINYYSKSKLFMKSSKIIFIH